MADEIDVNDNDTNSHPSSAKFLRCSSSCSAFGRPSVPDRSQMSTAYSISAMASSVSIVPSLRLLPRSGSAGVGGVAAASQGRHFDDGVCSCGPGARRNLARAGGVPRGAILTTRGKGWIHRRGARRWDAAVVSSLGSATLEAVGCVAAFGWLSSCSSPRQHLAARANHQRPRPAVLLRLGFASR
jgi:hypothetical protein